MSNYKFSVIIPVYNVEKYLKDALDSVVKQKIGMKNIQLILINDGSTDNSEAICLKYKNKYPENVIYIKKENGGVSEARNVGLKHAKGKYIFFMDSDDKISKNVLCEAYKLLEKNTKCECAVIRVKRFGKVNKKQYLDYRFGKNSEIIDLSKNPNFPMFSVCFVILKASSAKKYQFDTKLTIGEDFKYLAQVISTNPVIVTIPYAYYYYRVREDSSSAMQDSTSKRDYYVTVPKYSYEYILDLGKKYKNAKAWLQYSVLCQANFRVYDVNLEVLNEKEKQTYIDDMRRIYTKCDDEIIGNSFALEKPFNYKALNFKYKKSVFDDIKIDDNYVTLYGNKILDLNKLSIKIFVFQISGSKLDITASFDTFYNNDCDLFIKSNDKYYKFDRHEIQEIKNTLYSKDNDYYINYYNIKFDLKGVKEFEFYIRLNNKYYIVNPEHCNFSKINNLPHSYYKKGKYLITHNKNHYYVNKKVHFKLIKYLKDVFKKDKLVFGMLVIYIITYPFVSHKVWILGDRYDVAGDNGEWMFKYIKEKTNRKNVYFALCKGSKDIPTMRKIGKIINYNTINFFIKYMNSEVILSSHVDNFIRKTFGKRELYLNAFINHKFVFLQHGVTKNDMSNWLNKSNKNLDIIVCSANMEYEEFRNERYLYDENVPQLTGMPRYDNLYNGSKNTENLIAFMPTWRSSLSGPADQRTQTRLYNREFKKSEYYAFYNNLTHDKRLTDVLKKHNLKILFCLHPSLSSQLKDFKNTSFVEFKTKVYYPEVFLKAKLMLTDYSSVGFDFGYTKKPLIYSQYDKDHLYEIHTVLSGDGDFDYEKDGFGKVTYNYEDTLNEIIKIIENNFQTEKKYIDRINKFFKYQDDKNSARLYEQVLKMLDRDK